MVFCSIRQEDNEEDEEGRSENNNMWNRMYPVPWFSFVSCLTRVSFQNTHHKYERWMEHGREFPITSKYISNPRLEKLRIQIQKDFMFFDHTQRNI